MKKSILKNPSFSLEFLVLLFPTNLARTLIYMKVNLVGLTPFLVIKEEVAMPKQEGEVKNTAIQSFPWQ